MRAILQPFLEAAALSSRDEASAQPNLDEVIRPLLPALLSMSYLVCEAAVRLLNGPAETVAARVEAREKSWGALDGGLAELSAAGVCTTSVILAR